MRRLPPPTIYHDARGDRRFHHRRPALVAGPRIFCPEEHLLRDGDLVLEDQVLRCHAKLARGGGAECGALIYVLGHVLTRGDERLVVAVEVTHDEIRRMQQERMSVSAIVRYLGLDWRGPQEAVNHG